MTHELSYDNNETHPGRLLRAAFAMGGFAMKKTSHIRERIASFISPELSAEADLASVDSATGLPNRRAMQRQYEALLESGDPFAVIMIDLDDFKALNEKVGHENADELMLQFAGLLSTEIRGNDEVSYLREAYRTGGDEFVILAPLIPNTVSEEFPKSDEGLGTEERLSSLLNRLIENCLGGVELKDKSGLEVYISATYSAEIIDANNMAESDVVLNALSIAITSEKRRRRLASTE